MGCGGSGGGGHGPGGPGKDQVSERLPEGHPYQTLDRPDIKQYRELYAPPGVIEAVRKGKPIPSGAVLTLVQWSVEQDANGVPMKGPDGRFIKKDIIAHTVMEKQKGWGADYPESPRNGEWEYAVFTARQASNPKANNKACFTCHLPHAKQDFVISLAKLNNTFPGAQAVAKAKPKGDVNIVASPSCRQDQRHGRQAAQLPQHRRHAAPDHGGERPAHRGVPARPEGLAHHRQGRRVRLHLRPAPHDEGRDRGQVSVGA